MLSIQNLSKSHGARILFQDATIQFDAGSRYGIVGANGSGKSTLLRIISGEEEASDGIVSIPKRVRLGVMKQNHFQYEDCRIIDVVMMGIPELWEAMVEKEKILANAHEHFDADRYAEMEDVVLRFDGYSMEARAAEVLEGLNIPAAIHEQPLSTLSGGFKLRVLLAQTLASQPDALLLDEPTNHLDILSIKWLEGFLASFSGCVILVSHDRKFLNGICTHMIDVDYERVTVYKGNYDHFEDAKVLNRDQKEAEIKKRETEIAHHKRFIEKFKAKATKARQAQSKMKRVAKIVIDKLPESSRRYPLFKFQSAISTGKKVVEVENVSKSYGEKQVLNDVSLTVNRGDRVAVIGPNGIGKSTLLKIMMGLQEPDSGKSEWGHQADNPGYFSQDHEELKGADNGSIHDWLWLCCPTQPTGFVRGKLAEVLFGREEVSKKVGALSGGEASRLIFSYLSILSRPVMVLDEPTNHLDIEGIEALAKGLNKFEGSIIFVSHDRWFVSEVATRIFAITPEGVQDFKGTYQEYLAKQEEDFLDAEAMLQKVKSEKKKKKKKKK